ncbi:ATP/GTP-binding protein, partial [Jatrophihabitans sp.]|uniref:ATP/GTP-binding protein n=1 Tax=Jatrophihabitans sp. TaxID=1932789 RepID=UPI002EE8B9A1
MPRRNLPARHGTARKPGAAARGRGGQDGGGLPTGEQVHWWRGLEYRVRAVSGAASAASGPYRCPGCDQLLPADVGHLVAWPADDPEASDRRHWHTACWGARDRRSPG